MSQERLPFAAIRRSLADNPVIIHEKIALDSFGELPTLGMPEPHPVSDAQASSSFTLQRGLHLACSFTGQCAKALGPYRLRLARRDGRA